MIFNYLYKTKPSIIHSPGICPFFDDLVKINLNSKIKQENITKELTIITWNNNDNESILEKSLKLFNIKPIVVGKDIKNWKNTDKIRLTNLVLKKIKTKFVMGLDAFDVIVLKNPSCILNKFLKMNIKILFNASVASYPKIDSLLNFEESKYNSIYNHLNAGAWIGHTESVIDFWKLVGSIDIENKACKIINENNFNKKYINSEQLRVKLAFQDCFPLATIDQYCNIFQCLNFPELYKNEKLKYTQGIWSPVICPFL